MLYDLLRSNSRKKRRRKWAALPLAWRRRVSWEQPATLCTAAFCLELICTVEDRKRSIRQGQPTSLVVALVYFLRRTCKELPLYGLMDAKRRGCLHLGKSVTTEVAAAVIVAAFVAAAIATNRSFACLRIQVVDVVFAGGRLASFPPLLPCTS